MEFTEEQYSILFQLLRKEYLDNYKVGYLNYCKKLSDIASILGYDFTRFTPLIKENSVVK